MKRQKEQNVRELIDKLISELSVMNNEREVQNQVVSAFQCTHRTLQQNFMRHVIMPLFEEMHKWDKEGNYDLRNEASCKLATKMLGCLNEDDKMLPFI